MTKKQQNVKQNKPNYILNVCIKLYSFKFVNYAILMWCIFHNFLHTVQPYVKKKASF